MKIIVAKNYDDLSKIVAEIIKAHVNRKTNSVLGLATGGTPVGAYKELIRMNKEGSIDFSNVKTVNLDEYIGLPGTHKQSYRYFMNENLFNEINIDINNTFVPNGVAEDIEKEARNYDIRIDELGGIDLQLLGIGNNGHIAFNEPNTELTLGTHEINLTQDTIEANSRFFDSMDEVPKRAITMGIGEIMKAREIILMATGKSKAKAIKGLLSGKVTTNNPATLLQLHHNVTVVIDEEINNLIK